MRQLASNIQIFIMVLILNFSTQAQNGKVEITQSVEIEKVIDAVIKENPKMVEDYLGGKNKLLGFFVGQAMKKTKGKANPKILNDMLIKKLN